MSRPLNAAGAPLSESGNCNPESFVKAQERIKKLEGLLVAEIEEVAKLLKENQRLEAELETTQAKLTDLNKRYEKLNAPNKIRCNRDEAMAVSAMPSTPEASE